LRIPQRTARPIAPRAGAAIVKLRGVLRDIAVLVAVFVLVTLIAALLGATNLGTALTFGTIAFAGVLFGFMLYRGRDA
jgi:hypothetical protein